MGKSVGSSKRILLAGKKNTRKHQKNSVGEKKDTSIEKEQEKKQLEQEIYRENCMYYYY